MAPASGLFLCKVGYEGEDWRAYMDDLHPGGE